MTFMNRVGAVTRREEDSLLALLRYIGERSHRWSLSPAPAGPHPHPSAELLLLTGPSFILDVGTTLAGWMTLHGRTVLYVDGANAFDPYILSALAREAGQPPKAVLQRLHLSRAFTCHQFEALIADRLPGAIAHFRPGLVVISGWSHLFHDENVPAREAFRLFQNTAGRIHALAEAGQPILATHPLEPVTPRLQSLGETLARAADGVVRLREEEGLILVVREKPPDPHGARPLVLPQEDCRLWLRGRHRQELAGAYPWSGR